MLLARLPDGSPEVFATVQGEGVSAGVPSVFVRLAECNLRCGFCDTKYTWDWQNHDKTKETIELTNAAIAERVAEIAGASKTVVFTGGEPLLQQDELVLLVKELREKTAFRIEVETNGTIAPTEALAALVDQWNVSPKLASSGNGLKARHRPTALAWFAERANAFFKLVVMSEADLHEVQELVTALALPPDRVLLMPEGTDPATLAERSRWLVERCTERGYRLGARLHVHIWGAERGR
jgi:7-carboxy-7-deazaguanine synthase